MSRERLFASVASTAVAATIVIGFVIIGSPSTERARRQDQRRVSDLQSLSYSIDNYYVTRGSLPKDLAALYADSALTPVKGPDGMSSYRYEPGPDAAYRLCTRFERRPDAMTEAKDRYYAPVPTVPSIAPGLPEYRTWEHPTDSHCFDLTAPVKIK